SGQVRRDEVIPKIVARLVETPLSEDSGIVDDEVEHAELLVAARDPRDGAPLAAHVARDEDRPAAVPSCFFGGPAAGIGIPGHSDDARLFAAEGEQDLPTEPTGGPGDDTPLS